MDAGCPKVKVVKGCPSKSHQRCQLSEYLKFPMAMSPSPVVGFFPPNKTHLSTTKGELGWTPGGLLLRALGRFLQGRPGGDASSHLPFVNAWNGIRASCSCPHLCEQPDVTSHESVRSAKVFNETKLSWKLSLLGRHLTCNKYQQVHVRNVTCYCSTDDALKMIMPKRVPLKGSPGFFWVFCTRNAVKCSELIFSSMVTCLGESQKFRWDILWDTGGFRGRKYHSKGSLVAFLRKNASAWKNYIDRVQTISTHRIHSMLSWWIY